MITLIGPVTDYHGQGRITKLLFYELEEKLPEFKVKKINTYHNGNLISKYFFHLRMVYQIFYSVKKSSIIYFTPSRNLFASFRDFTTLFFTKKNTRVIAHVHGSDLYAFLNQKTVYHKYLKKLYLKKLSRCIILSNSHKKYSLGDQFNNYTVIQNPLSEIHTSKELVSKRISFCTISNPIKEKGLDSIIQQLNEKFKLNKIHLDVIGWTKEDYHKVYSEPPLLETGTIKFHGRLDGAEKLKILQRSKFFIFLSRYESEAQPLTVLEALSVKSIVVINKFKMMIDFKEYPNINFIEDLNTEQDILNLPNELEVEEVYSNLLSSFSIERFKKEIWYAFH